MKKFTMLSSVLASALMLTVASCSSEDVAGGDSQNDKGGTSFLAVNIENVGSAPASRSSYEQNKGTYEDGTADESKITNVRFYFFNGDGTPYLLDNNGSEKQPVNFLDQKVETAGNDHDHTAEIKTKAVLVLKGETKAVPASVIAVINPEVLDNTTLQSGTMTLSELRTSATGSKFHNDTNGFVMSNSAYESAGQDVCSTPVANSVFATAEDATKNPVDIYVERVNAKVNAKIDATYKRDGESTTAWTKNTDGKYQIEVGNIEVTTYATGNTNAKPTTKTYPVYAVVQGWQLADANGKAEVCKQINTSWYAGELGISPWTTSDYHRCFWSKSVPFNFGAQGGANHPVNPKFEDIKLSLSDEFSTTPVYTLPNTPDKVVTNPKTSVNTLTKLIVAAKLVYQDDNGNYKNAQVCQYRGLTYLGEDAVKKQIAGSFTQYFKKASDASGATIYKSLEASDIAFKTAPGSSEVKNYEVVATLASTVGDLYVKNGEAWTTVSKDDVNAALAKEDAQVRTADGATYYYTPIKHLGDAGKLGEYGIVRNHSYQVTIQNIKGFGTPVYDPKKEIDPMVPSDENTYLAASIKVLSWRVVSSKVDLDQTK